MTITSLQLEVPGIDRVFFYINHGINARKRNTKNHMSILRSDRDMYEEFRL